MLLKFSAILMLAGFVSLYLLVVLSMKKSMAIAGIAGLLVFASQVYSRDKLRFWFVVFLFAIPLAAPKFLGDREAMQAVLGQLGVPTGAPPLFRIFISDLLMVLLLSVYSYRLLRGQERVYFPRRQTVLFVMLILWSALSFINTVNFSYSFLELIRMCKFLVLFLLIVNIVRTERDLKVFIACMAIGMLIQGAICALQYKFQTSFSLTGYSYMSEIGGETVSGTIGYGSASGDSRLRGSGTVGPHNLQAMYFELLLPLITAAAYIFRKKLMGWLCIASVLVGLGGLYFTFSRGGLVGSFCGLFALLLLMIKFKFTSKRVLVAVMLLIAVTGTLFHGKIVDYMSKREGFRVRIEMSKVGLAMVKDRPILGFGLNTSVIHLPDYDRKNVTIGYPVHNHYLILASEIGIVGLGLWFSFYLFTICQGIRAGKRLGPVAAATIAGIVAGLAGIAVHMGWDHFGDEVIQTLLWIYAGIIIAITRPDFLTTSSAPVKAVS